MKWRALTILSALALATRSPLLTAKEWQPSTLSQQAITKARDGTRAYHLCLNREIKLFERIPMDSRDATSLILKKCEFELTPIRTALLAEQVPPVIADRYLRRKRTQAIRHVLQLMMYAESRRRTTPTGEKTVP